MALRTFKMFPPNALCPICGTGSEGECFLVPVDGTDDGNICEAKPIHVKCITHYAEAFRIELNINVMYMRINGIKLREDEGRK